MTKTKITSRIHKGAQSHQQEAFDHHHTVSQRIFHTRRNGKIADLVIGQVHVTDRHDTNTNEDTVEAKVKTAFQTRIKDLQVRTRI